VEGPSGIMVPLLVFLSAQPAYAIKTINSKHTTLFIISSPYKGQKPHNSGAKYVLVNPHSSLSINHPQQKGQIIKSKNDLAIHIIGQTTLLLETKDGKMKRL
jgi:hypothetical protein